MQTPLSNLKISFLFLFSILSLNIFGVEAPEVWTKVSLTKEDHLGARTLMVLARNADGFAKFVAKTGGPLNDSVQIAYKTVPGADKNYKHTENGVTTRTNTSVGEYILGEKKADGSLSRVLLVEEHVTTTSYSKKKKPKDPLSAEDLVPDPSERTPKGETPTEYARRINPKIIRKYPATVVDLAKLDAKTIAEYEKAFAKLDADPSKPVELSSGATLSLVSKAATELIKKASYKADALAEEIAKITAKDSQLEFDEASPKTVTYFVNQKGEFKDVKVSGLICRKGEKFEAPDARSAWELTINGVHGKPTELIVKVEERKSEPKVKAESLSFETY